MKKILFLLPTLFLTSCANAGSVSFKNNLVVGEKVTDLKDFYEHVNAQFENAKTIKMEGKAFSKYGFTKVNTRSSLNCTIYTNGFSSKSEIISRNRENGIVQRTIETESQDTFILNINGKTKMHSFVKTGDDEVGKYTSTTVDPNYTAKISEQDILNYLEITKYLDINVYKKGTQFLIVSSNEDMDIEDVQSGSKVKEHKTIEKSQLIMTVDSSYHLKSATYYYINKTNRDPETNEWYNGLKTIAKAQIDLEVKYGSLSTRTEADLHKKLGNSSWSH